MERIMLNICIVLNDTHYCVKQHLQNLLMHFNEISSTFRVSPRYIMKETDNLLWTILREVLQINNITLTFQKVRAHSGDLYNEKWINCLKLLTIIKMLTF